MSGISVPVCMCVSYQLFTVFNKSAPLIPVVVYLYKHEGSAVCSLYFSIFFSEHTFDR